MSGLVFENRISVPPTTVVAEIVGSRQVFFFVLRTLTHVLIYTFIYNLTNDERYFFVFFERRSRTQSS